MNQILNLSNLDSGHALQRQSKLSKNQLKYEPERLQQLPIHINNIISGPNEVFQVTAINLRNRLPNEDLEREFQQYLSQQMKIDNLNQGYLNELEEREVAGSIESIKESILKVEDQLEQLHKYNIAKRQSLKVLQEQIAAYGRYADQNNDAINKIIKKNQFKGVKEIEGKMNQHEKELQGKVEELQENTKIYEQKRDAYMDKLKTVYKEIVEEKTRSMQLMSKLEQLRVRESQVKNQISIVHQKTWQLEEQIEHLEGQVAKKSEEEENRIEAARVRPPLNLSESQRSERPESPPSSVSSSIRQSRKVHEYNHIKVQKQAEWLPLVLAIVSVGLLVLTGYKFL